MENMTIKTAATEAVKFRDELLTMIDGYECTLSGNEMKTILTLIDYLAQIVSGEMVVVPRDPTEKMIDAGVDASWKQSVSHIYLAMIGGYEETP
jgi:hypothetical protein